MNFMKMHGLGNDFVIINNIKGNISLNKDQVKQLANRNFGIGFDQLLMVEKSDIADFKYIIFNADGTEVEQCGNGARCFAKFVLAEKLTNKNPVLVETSTGLISIQVNNDNTVTVDMGTANFNPKTIIKNPKEQDIYQISNFELGLVSMGNPHAILIVDNLANEIKTIGEKIQNSTEFINSVNVGFMQIIDKSNIKLRVYERGSGETLACGSGACAAVSFGIKQGLLKNKVTVSLRGGDCIIEKTPKTLFLSGSAEFVFKGNIDDSYLESLSTT